MDELLELIGRIGKDDAPTDEELADARAELVELLTAAAEGDDRDLEAAKALRAAIDTIDAEIKAREDKIAADDEEAKKLLEGIVDETSPGDEGDEGDEGAGEGAGEGDPEGQAKQPAAVAAADLGPALKRARSRVQANAEPTHRFDVKVRAIGAAQGYPLSHDSTMDDVAKLFSADATAVRSGRQSLVRIEKIFPDDRQLGKQTAPNNRILEAVFAPANMTVEAVGAAGGICGPLEADHNHPICGDRGRPIRDAITQFQADRGGIRYTPSATLADVSGGITVWDIETDESPGVETKACLVVDCPEELEAKVDAVVACLQIGNFQARFNPELWRSRLDLLMVAHDRTAETQLYNDIVTASIATTYAGSDGTIYSVLSAVDKAVAGIRSRLRLLPSTAFQMIAPEWLHQALRADIAKQRIGGNPAEALAVADQVIDTFFSVRGVRPVWSPDVDLFGAQGAGALLEFPGGNVAVVIYPVGTFMFLDGGTLDLGTEITDSTLNQTNDRQAFMETFEKVVFRGCQSLVVTIPVTEACQCPDVLELTSPAA